MSADVPSMGMPGTSVPGVGPTTVYTAGVFDLLHLGHLRILERAADLGDRLVVAVSTDELVRSYKGAAPVVPYTERAELVAALRCVDEVVPQTDRDKAQAWERIRFDVWVVGDDWKGDPYYTAIEEQLAAKGVRCVYLPYTAGVSTTMRREQVRERRPD